MKTSTHLSILADACSSLTAVALMRSRTLELFTPAPAMMAILSPAAETKELMVSAPAIAVASQPLFFLINGLT